MTTAVIVSMDRNNDQDDGHYRTLLELTRSSILYADNVILMSPMFAMAEGADVANANRLLFFTQFLDTAASHVAQDDPNLADRLADPQRQQAIFGDLLNEIAAGEWGRRQVSDLPRIRELNAGRHGQLVEFKHISVDWRLEPTEVAAIFLERVRTAISSPTTHAVCDRSASNALRQAMLETDSGDRRHRIGELGSGLIARLPAFPHTPLDELLDLKSELGTAIKRYRRAIAALERELPESTTIEQLDDQITELWLEQVDPAVSELIDELASHTFTRELARSTGRSVKELIYGGSAVAVSLSMVADIAAAVAAGAGIAASAVQAAALGKLAAGESARRLQQSDFYYLARLAQRTSRYA